MKKLILSLVLAASASTAMASHGMYYYDSQDPIGMANTACHYKAFDGAEATIRLHLSSDCPTLIDYDQETGDWKAVPATAV